MLGNIDSSDGRMDRASISGSVHAGLVPGRVKTNDFKTGIHIFSASHPTLKRKCGKHASKYACSVVEKCI